MASSGCGVDMDTRIEPIAGPKRLVSRGKLRDQPSHSEALPYSMTSEVDLVSCTYSASSSKSVLHVQDRARGETDVAASEGVV